MAYLCVNKNGQEVICPNEPTRQYGEWSDLQGDFDFDQVDYAIEIPNGSIEKLTGVKMTWKDKPKEMIEPKETFLDRLNIETKELKLKQQKLSSFVGTDKFKELPFDSQKDLICQEQVMKMYLNILEMRVDNLTIKEPPAFV